MSSLSYLIGAYRDALDLIEVESQMDDLHRTYKVFLGWVTKLTKLDPQMICDLYNQNSIPWGFHSDWRHCLNRGFCWAIKEETKWRGGFFHDGGGCLHYDKNLKAN